MRTRSAEVAHARVVALVPTARRRWDTAPDGDPTLDPLAADHRREPDRQRAAERERLVAARPNDRTQRRGRARASEVRPPGATGASPAERNVCVPPGRHIQRMSASPGRSIDLGEAWRDLDLKVREARGGLGDPREIGRAHIVTDHGSIPFGKDRLHSPDEAAPMCSRSPYAGLARVMFGCGCGLSPGLARQRNHSPISEQASLHVIDPDAGPAVVTRPAVR